MCVIVFPALTLTRVSSLSYRRLESLSISNKRSDLYFSEMSASEVDLHQAEGWKIELFSVVEIPDKENRGGPIGVREGLRQSQQTLTRYTTRVGFGQRLQDTPVSTTAHLKTARTTGEVLSLAIYHQTPTTEYDSKLKTLMMFLQTLELALELKKKKQSRN